MLEYGIKCKKDNEKQIVKNINDFLINEYNYRKMDIQKDISFSMFNYGDIYCLYTLYTEKKPHWYFDLMPNEDLDGNWKFDNKDIGWVLFFIKTFETAYNEKDHVDVDLFLKKLLEAIGFEIVLLHEYKKGELRIGIPTTDEERAKAIYIEKIIKSRPS
jgi:hypothetical protein